MSSHKQWEQSDQDFDLSLQRVMKNWSKNKKPPTNVRHKILMAAAIERSRKPSRYEIAMDWLADLVLAEEPAYIAQDRLYTFFPQYVVPVFQAEFATFRQVI
jgi:hypothetical protein